MEEKRFKKKETDVSEIKKEDRFILGGRIGVAAIAFGIIMTWLGIDNKSKNEKKSKK